MTWTNPTQPNVIDFFAFVLGQGIPGASLPSGSLTTVAIDTSGNLTAASFTGTISVGMVVVGDRLPDNTYLSTWNGSNAGTVTPVPAVPAQAASAVTLSPYLQWAFNVAVGIALYPPSSMPPLMYVIAVYNLGMHQILKIAQDPPGGTFFSTQRSTFNLLSFQAGPVAASADQATSETLVTADFIKGLTMQGLDLLNTPWGREYLAYAQMYGPNIVGVS